VPGIDEGVPKQDWTPFFYFGDEKLKNRSTKSVGGREDKGVPVKEEGRLFILRRFDIATDSKKRERRRIPCLIANPMPARLL
jgi:hypothetical protein